MTKLFVVGEQTKRAFDTGEMPFKDRKHFVEASKDSDVLVFPDALMPDVEKEFPVEEAITAKRKYLSRHPEKQNECEKWKPTL
jgi:hypothetical protein